MNSKVDQRHWAEIGETTSAAGIIFLCTVHRWLGRWPFLLCLYPVVMTHWLSNGTARRASLEYLRRVWLHADVLPKKPGAWQSFRHFCWFGETLLDKLLATGRRYPQSHVVVHREQVLKFIDQRRGGVIVTAHMGCLELCQVLAESVPRLQLTILVHTAHAERVNRMMRLLDPSGRVELLQVTELGPGTAMMLAERIATGGFVAIAGDRVPLRGGRSVATTFLGREAHFPIGAYVLASAIGCPVFTMSCLHRGAGYEVQLEPFAERIVLPRGSRDLAIAEQVNLFATWLEGQVLASPYDWFNFYSFWDQVADEQGR